MPSSKEIGKLGEDIAVKFLRKKRYKILERNFQKDIKGLKLGEIDIVAKKDKVVIFTEVKTLKRESGISPEERVNFRKRQTIAKIAEIWLNKHKIPLNSPWQIDILAIVLNFDSRIAKIKHFKNI
ncbi:YraN family protein [Patescibacteria group bacterium]|nr:YraN family protein [Patescibacteria group bacterium]MBU4023369.1 YraN family protein [Patescibacteria group bacterium]MBU4078535.1 YraN family protein [Patescibacteria group bacterium]